MYYMTLVEENESDYKTRLSLWRNVENEVYIEVGLNGEENDPYTQQSIALGIDDAKILLLELRRIIAEIESDTEPVTQEQTDASQALKKDANGQLKLMPAKEPPKKKPVEVHARYVKNGNGQMEPLKPC